MTRKEVNTAIEKGMMLRDSVYYMADNKRKITTYYNDGNKSIKSEKRVWEDDKGTYHKSAFGEKMYIQNCIMKRGDYEYLWWQYVDIETGETKSFCWYE